MNQVAGIYPHSITFAREEIRLQPQVTRWSVAISPIPGLLVHEGDTRADWQLFIDAMRQQNEEYECKP